VLGGMGVDVPKWIRRIENRRASELTIDPKSADAVAALRAVENEFNDSVIRLVAFVKIEPVFEVGDARLGHRDRLILLVKEGRPFEILEPYDMSNLEVTNETEKLAADNEPGAETP